MTRQDVSALYIRFTRRDIDDWSWEKTGRRALWRGGHLGERLEHKSEMDCTACVLYPFKTDICNEELLGKALD